MQLDLSMSATKQRDQAIRIAQSDYERALSRAEEIDDPWFAAQTLAAVLRYAPEDRMDFVCRRAIKQAARGADAYQRGAVLAWLVRALAERERPAQATEVLQEAVCQALQASPAGSRAEALFLLYQAACPLGRRSLDPLLGHLAALYQQAPHWRCARAVVHACAIHSVIEGNSFQTALKSLSDPGLITRIHRAISLGQTRPREFFWEH